MTPAEQPHSVLLLNDFARARASTQRLMPPEMGTTLLALGPRDAWVLCGADMPPSTSLRLELGVVSVAETCFKHDWPTALELERAIDAVEAEVMRVKPHVPSLLVSTDRWLSAWVQTQEPPAMNLTPQNTGLAISREDLEALFQRLASAALGNPLAMRGLPQGREAAAALLIAREFMHHLDHSMLLCQVAEPHQAFLA